MRIWLIFLLILVSCSNPLQEQFSDDEIAEYAETKGFEIVYNSYNSYDLFSLSIETLGSHFESGSIISVQIKASYEWHTKEWSRTAGGYLTGIGWVGGLIDRQFKGDRTHLVRFKVVRDVGKIENTIRYLSATPPFETPRAFSN